MLILSRIAIKSLLNAESQDPNSPEALLAAKSEQIVGIPAVQVLEAGLHSLEEARRAAEQVEVLRLYVEARVVRGEVKSQEFEVVAH